MKLGRIDSVLPQGSSSMVDDEDESSTISFHVSSKYTYTLTFSSTISVGRGIKICFFLVNALTFFQNHVLGDGNKISMSYGKRVQLNSLFDSRQPMSTVQSLEIQLTPVLNNSQEIVKSLCS